MPRAFEAADRALQLAPSLPEALFNRAVALERLRLKQEAIDAWRRYLAVDDSTPWSREARERLSALEAVSATDRGKPRTQHLRDQLLDSVLADWGLSVPTNPSRARELLEEAHGMAAKLARLAPSDAFAADVVAAVSRANERTRQDLARGHAEFGRARQLYLAGQLGEAAQHFARARTALGRSGSKLAILADLYASIIDYRRDEFDRSLMALRAGLQAASGRPYPSVSGRIHWMFGNIAMFQGRHGEAAASYTRALEDFVVAGETGYEANAWSLLANLHGQLGARKHAWNEWTRALALIAAEPDSPQKQGLLLAAAEDAFAGGWFATASRLQESALGVAVRTNNTAAIVDTLLRKAVLFKRTGRATEAAQAIADAREKLSALTGDAMTGLQAELDLAEARSVLANSPLHAAAAASRAVSYYSGTDGMFRLPAAYAVLAGAQSRAGELDSAVTSLERGLAAAERQRKTLSVDAQRLYADSLRALGDEHVALLVRQQRTTEAFEALERTKNRLLRQAALSDAAPASATHLAKWLPHDAIFVAFSVHDGEVLRWTVKCGQLKFAPIPLARQTLEQLVTSTAHRATSRDARAKLTTLLLSGVVDHEDNGKQLVLMLDGPLHRVSFAALRGITHEHLIEEHPITITPSATFLIHASDRLASNARTAASILAVGNPPVDRLAFPGLGPLPEAAAEIADIGAFYRRSTTFADKEATPDKVITKLPSADVFHFAGHAVMNDAVPAMSQLVVSVAGTSGITAGEIERLNLGRSRLAVLSTCHAAAGPLSASEGPMNLVRPFFAAGVPVVVASLRKVEDRASRQLMVDFHRRYRQSGDAAFALRAAQMEAIRRVDEFDEPSWSAFAVFGALSGISRRDAS